MPRLADAQRDGFQVRRRHDVARQLAQRSKG
jgi:hypothetical protein